MTINTNLLNLVADYLDDGTIKFDLGTFASPIEDRRYDGEEVAHLCDSKFCIAGATVWLALGEQTFDFDYEGTAARLLGLDVGQAQRLFYAGNSHGDSVWVRSAEEFDWETSPYDGVEEWGEIEAPQAAIVLRRIASGEIEL